MEKLVYLDGNSLTIEQVVDVCRHGAKVALTEEAKKAVQISRDIVEENVSAGKVVYGLSTGFGKFVNVAIPEEDLDLLQYNLIVSDACGVGDPFKEDVTRAIMLLRINALAKGFSGIRLSTVETLVEMLNKGVHPVIPEKGSVGSSGDLCPLAHMVMPMIGEGEAIYQGKLMSGQEAMKAAGIPVISLKAKEGLALINGTCAMTGVGSLAVYDASILIKTADIAASLTVDALEGIISAFDPRIQPSVRTRARLMWRPICVKFWTEAVLQCRRANSGCKTLTRCAVFRKSTVPAAWLTTMCAKSSKPN